MIKLYEGANAIAALSPDQRFGRVIGVRGALIEVEGLVGAAGIGARVAISDGVGSVEAEVTGIDRNLAQCLPFGDLQGIVAGSRVDLRAGQFVIRPDARWLGRGLGVRATSAVTSGHGAS